MNIEEYKTKKLEEFSKKMRECEHKERSARKLISSLIDEIAEMFNQNNSQENGKGIER